MFKATLATEPQQVPSFSLTLSHGFRILSFLGIKRGLSLKSQVSHCLPALNKRTGCPSLREHILTHISGFNFGGSRKKCGLGPHTKGTENGLNLQTCPAVTPEGLNLGVLNLNVYVKERVQGQKVDRKKRPIEEKESYRWYQGMELCGKVAGQARSEERRVGKECRSRWSPYH